MSERYDIPDPKYYNGEFGTIQQPHLYKITFGRKFQKKKVKNSSYCCSKTFCWILTFLVALRLKDKALKS